MSISRLRSDLRLRLISFPFPLHQMRWSLLLVLSLIHFSLLSFHSPLWCIQRLSLQQVQPLPFRAKRQAVEEGSSQGDAGEGKGREESM